METIEHQPVLLTKEGQINVESLRQFADSNLHKYDNAKDPDKEYAGKYPDRYHGRLADGKLLSIHLTSEENKVTTEFNGEQKEILARVWVSDNNGDKSSAYCYKLLRAVDGTEQWVIQKSNKEPRHDEDLITNYWSLNEATPATSMDLAAMQLFFDSRKQKIASHQNSLPQ